MSRAQSWLGRWIARAVYVGICLPAFAQGTDLQLPDFDSLR
jgi:hypothetical protein